MARTFNGSSQYLNHASGLSLGANDAIWVSFWLWVNSLAASYGIFNIGIAGSSNGWRRITTNASSGIVVTSTNTSAASGSATGTLPGAAQWVHILAEWGSTASRKVTVNGGTPATNTTSINVGSTPDTVRLAATLAPSAYLAGRLAYVAIFSGAPAAQDYIDLSGSGVEADALHPTLTTSAANLLAYWDLDGTNSPEPDGVGSNDMTLVGSPTQSTSPSIDLVGGGGGPAIILPQGWWL